MTRCRHSWRGLDTITAITRDVGDPFQYVHNAQAQKHQVCVKHKTVVFELYDPLLVVSGHRPSNRDNIQNDKF